MSKEEKDLEEEEGRSQISLTLSEIENYEGGTRNIPQKLGLVKNATSNTSMLKISTPFSASNQNVEEGLTPKKSSGSRSSTWEEYQEEGPSIFKRENSTVFRRPAEKKRNKSIIQNQLLARTMTNEVLPAIRDKRFSALNTPTRLSETRQSSVLKSINKVTDENGTSSRTLRRRKHGTSTRIEEDPKRKGKLEKGVSKKAEKKLKTKPAKKEGKLLEYLTLRTKRNNEKRLTMERSRMSARLEPNKVVHLSRGGVYVNTSIGGIQFGIPPETIKDTLNGGLTPPLYYVLPKEKFNLTVGVNVAELEFPTFYNFFIKKQRITLVTEKKTKEDVETIFRESLYGPTKEYLFSDREFEHCPPDVRQSRPDHAKELAAFASFTLDELIGYCFFDDNGYGFLKDEKGDLVIVHDNKERFCFEIFDYKAYKARIEMERQAVSQEKGILVIEKSEKEDPLDAFKMARGNGFEYCFQSILYDDAEQCKFSSEDAGRRGLESDGETEIEESIDEPQKPKGGRKTLMRKKNLDKSFNIPNFGLTILGNSHGFDPKGTTTGFVLWINGKGVMVDPPPHSSQFLISHGILPKLITAIILTHCHADHDAGTFQKMITEQKVELMTSATIFESFKRKYSAISNLTPEFIDQLVKFRPVFLEEPNYWNGAQFRFFYSLHTIPCIGFEVRLDDQSIVYSADTLYGKSHIDKLYNDGVLSEGRRNSLMDFPWHCDVVLHESGIPPIHTPIESFLELPEEKRKNIHLVHIDETGAEKARKKKLKVAKPGLNNSIILKEGDKHYTTTKLLQVVSSMEIFEHISVSKALELVLMAKPMKYVEGQILVRENETHDRFIIIVSGTASIKFGELERKLFEGDYFGELMFVEDKEIDRSKYEVESVSAVTPLFTLELDQFALKNLMLGDNELQSKMEIIIRARIAGCWEAIESNEMLSSLSVSQKTILQSILVERKFKQGEIVSIEDEDEDGKKQIKKWQKGEEVAFAVLILSGELIFDEVHNIDTEEDDEFNVPPLSTGMLLYDYRASVSSDSKLKTTLRALSDEAVIFTSEKDLFGRFLESNPLVLLGLFHSEVLP